MSNIFDMSEFESFEKDLIKLANDVMPKECKKFIRTQGNKLKKTTLAAAKSSVNAKNGQYHNSIKRGKVYKYRGNGAWAVRVYSSDPKAHLIEDGHRIITRGKGKKAKKHYTKENGGKECGFVPGKKVFKKSQQSFKTIFDSEVGKFIDHVIVGGIK